MTRLDTWLVERGHFTSRQAAKRAIRAGSVTVDGRNCKPSTEIRGTESVEILEKFADTPRGFQKLQKIDDLLDGKLVGRGDYALDIGSSAGGFLLYLAHKDTVVLGIEVSERFLPELESIVEQNHNVSVIIADAFDVDPLEIAERDTLNLLLIDVTTNLLGTLSLAQKFTPLLKPGGYILAAFKSSHNEEHIMTAKIGIRQIGYGGVKHMILDPKKEEFHISAHRL